VHTWVRHPARRTPLASDRPRAWILTGVAQYFRVLWVLYALPCHYGARRLAQSPSAQVPRRRPVDRGAAQSRRQDRVRAQRRVAPRPASAARWRRVAARAARGLQIPRHDQALRRRRWKRWANPTHRRSALRAESTRDAHRTRAHRRAGLHRRHGWGGGQPVSGAVRAARPTRAAVCRTHARTHAGMFIVLRSEDFVQALESSRRVARASFRQATNPIASLSGPLTRSCGPQRGCAQSVR
jgi:hypothetical protein